MDRLQMPLALSEEAILNTVGPATDSIGGKDLRRLAGDLLLAAERKRDSHGGCPGGGDG